MTWILGQSIPLASCRAQNRKKWIIPQRVVLLSSGTLTGWRNGLTGTSCCSTRAESCTWEQPPHPSIHAGGHSPGKQLYRREPGGPGRLQIEYEPAVHPCVRKANGVLSCMRHSMATKDDPATLLSTDEAIFGCCVQFWTFLYKGDTELLVRCQPRTTKMIKGMKSLS